MYLKSGSLATTGERILEADGQESSASASQATKCPQPAADVEAPPAGGRVSAAAGGAGDAGVSDHFKTEADPLPHLSMLG